MFADLHAELVELAPFVPPAPAAPLREIKFHRNAWLPAEIDQLRALFAADVPIEAIAEQIGRPFSGVRDKLFTLGLRRNSTRPWSELEDAWLVQHYRERPASALAGELGRSASAVYVRAQLLGLSEGNPPPYTAWEDAQLREGYARAIPVGQIATLIGRPFAGVVSRAQVLGLRHPAKPDDWSEEEMARALILAHEGHRYLAIIEQLVAEGFPRRTKNGFGQRLRLLGYGRGWGRAWLPDEDELLRRAYSTGASLTPLRDRLGRTRESIAWRAGYLGLQGTHEKKAGWRTEPAWTEAEIERLREAYGKMPNKALAAEMGRSRMAISTKAWNLGLEHGYWRPYTADELRAFQVAHDHGLAIADLAIALNRAAMTVSKYATDKLGLHFGRRPRRKPPLSLAEILCLGGDRPERPKRRRHGAWQPRPSRLELVLRRRIRPRGRGANR